MNTISGGTFIGQLGDSNTMIIKSLINNINTGIEKRDEVQILLKQLVDSIDQSQELDKYVKNDTKDSLTKIMDMLSKPANEQDKDWIGYYLKKIGSLVKDIVPIFETLKKLGTILGLALP